MNTSAMPDPEALEAALDRAVRDGTVASFKSLERMLAQLPAESHDEIREKIEARGGPIEGAWYHVAWVRIEQPPDGSWTIRYPCGHETGLRAGYVLVVASDQERYDGARHNILEIIARKLLPRN